MASSPLSKMAPFGMDARKMDVLLVDDDEDLVDVSLIYLEKELDSGNIDTETNPETALEKAISGNYDCIISDYDMPQMNGLDFFEALRENGVHVPFILFTGKGSEEIAGEALSIGVDEYLQKGGTDKYTVLAKKVDNLVEKSWAEMQVRQGFQAIESAHDGIAIISDDGDYEYLNPAYAEVYDRNRAEIVDQHWRMLYPDAEVDRFNAEILPALSEEGVWRGLATGIRKDGGEVPERLVLNSMEDGGHVCIIQDLTKEDELKTDLALKNKALEAASIGVVISDPTQEDNPIVEMNDGFVELTGYDRDEILGKNCRFLQGENTDPDTVMEIREAVDEGKTITTEILNYKADGTPFWNLLEISPVEDDCGNIINYIGLQYDITARKTYRDNIEEELDWLSGFGDVLSHDLKTPVSVIAANINLAKETEDFERLEKAERAVNRLTNLIEDLANVMKQGDLVNEVSPIELESVFRSWDSFKTAPESFEIVDSKVILADEMAIIRLADNLVNNTVEHGNKHVPMRIGVLPDGFYYEDDGPGIPEGEREDVFKPGFTTKEDGTGFGMVSIKQISLAHGWSVSIAESAGGGARFEFTGVEVP